MSGFPTDLADHLAAGLTSLCRCWMVARRDGVTLGFTDHDRDIVFDGITFRADSGMTAAVLQQGTGLAVDNSEALGALSDASVREADILAGRFDGASVRSWLVNWQEPKQRVALFQGSIGELRQVGGQFQAELRGLAEKLNLPQGRLYQRDCAAVLGDARCGVDLAAGGYSIEVPVEEFDGRKRFRFADLTDFDDRWFERGRMRVLTGAAAGLIGVVKNDRLSADGRAIELWQDLRCDIAKGDTIRLEAGCDKRAETCRLKFANMANFRGFPTIPGEDWLMAVPARLVGTRDS